MSETSITVIGNVVRRVEVRNTNSGAKVTKFSVASSKSWKGENGWEQTETSYFDVECWGKLAEHVNNTLWKGQSVIVYGSIRTDRWEDDNGQSRQRQKIVAKAIGPNLRHHLATVTTLKEKPHEQPAGRGFAGVGQSGADRVSGVENSTGEATDSFAGSSDDGPADAGKALAGAGAGAGTGQPPF